MNLIYHLVSEAYFVSQDPNADYFSASFGLDGFVHCTQDANEMARVANQFYGADPNLHVYLYVDADRLTAPIVYEDEGSKYPHVYGGLNRQAIVDVRIARRDAEGHFQPPDMV